MSMSMHALLSQEYVQGQLLPDGWTYIGNSDHHVPPKLTPEEEEAILQLHLERCGIALKDYNDTKGEDYEIVKFMESRLFFFGPYSSWHYNFEAKNSTDDSTKLFFAEYCERFVTDCMESCVNYCMILDPSTAVRDCESCGDDAMLHPPNLIVKRPTWWEGQ